MTCNARYILYIYIKLYLGTLVSRDTVRDAILLLIIEARGILPSIKSLGS